MALTITSTTNSDALTVVAAQGEVDVSCASELRDAIEAVLATRPVELEVDLGEVPYIDSTGIGVLVGSAKRAREAGVVLRVTNVQRNVRRVLDMLAISQELGVTSETA